MKNLNQLLAIQNLVWRNLATLILRSTLFCSLLLVIGPANLIAAVKPECFPNESAWDNMELTSVNVPNDQQPEIKQEQRAVILTFNKFATYLPEFYGFAFLKTDVTDIPGIDQDSEFNRYFGKVNLLSLQNIPIDSHDSDQKSYRFTPPSKGTWVIYLVASVKKIPFLEQRKLKISPNVEQVRGGSIFSGASLDLIEPIDYKACVMTMNE